MINDRKPILIYEQVWFKDNFNHPLCEWHHKYECPYMANSLDALLERDYFKTKRAAVNSLRKLARKNHKRLVVSEITKGYISRDCQRGIYVTFDQISKDYHIEWTDNPDYINDQYFTIIAFDHREHFTSLAEVKKRFDEIMKS